MAQRVVGMQVSVWRYSATRRRSLFAMVARRALLRVNGSAGSVLFKPLVVLAARVLGPGPTRLRLVKLAHNLNHHDVPSYPRFELVRDQYDEEQALPTGTRRAA